MSHAFAELAKRTEEITPFLAVEVFERAQELEQLLDRVLMAS